MLEKTGNLRFKDLNTPVMDAVLFLSRESHSVKLSGLLNSGLGLITPAYSSYTLHCKKNE